MCLRQGTFPQRLKTAKNVCVHKGGQHNTMTNYRPISVVSAFAKIIEKIVALHLYKCFEQNSFITVSKIGFRAGKSTESLVCNLFDTVASNVDRVNFTMSVSPQLAKVLDSIDRSILRGHVLPKYLLLNEVFFLCNIGVFFNLIRR